MEVPIEAPMGALQQPRKLENQEQIEEVKDPKYCAAPKVLTAEELAAIAAYEQSIRDRAAAVAAARKTYSPLVWTDVVPLEKIPENWIKNGGVVQGDETPQEPTCSYLWSQDWEDVTIRLLVPADTRSRDVSMVVARDWDGMRMCMLLSAGKGGKGKKARKVKEDYLAMGGSGINLLLFSDVILPEDDSIDIDWELGNWGIDGLPHEGGPFRMVSCTLRKVDRPVGAVGLSLWWRSLNKLGPYIDTDALEKKYPDKWDKWEKDTKAYVAWMDKLKAKEAKKMKEKEELMKQAKAMEKKEKKEKKKEKKRAKKEKKKAKKALKKEKKAKAKVEIEGEGGEGGGGVQGQNAGGGGGAAAAAGAAGVVGRGDDKEKDDASDSEGSDDSDDDESDDEGDDTKNEQVKLNVVGNSGAEEVKRNGKLDEEEEAAVSNATTTRIVVTEEEVTQLD